MGLYIRNNLTLATQVCVSDINLILAMFFHSAKQVTCSGIKYNTLQLIQTHPPLNVKFDVSCSGQQYLPAAFLGDSFKFSRCSEIVIRCVILYR